MPAEHTVLSSIDTGGMHVDLEDTGNVLLGPSGHPATLLVSDIATLLRALPLVRMARDAYGLGDMLLVDVPELIAQQARRRQAAQAGISPERYPQAELDLAIVDLLEHRLTEMTLPDPRHGNQWPVVGLYRSALGAMRASMLHWHRWQAAQDRGGGV